MLERIFPGLAAKRERNRAEAVYMAKCRSMMEALPEWVDEGDDEDWVQFGKSGKVYTPAELATMREQAVKMYYVYPGARGVIEAMVLFILGRNADVAFEDDKAAEYWDAWAEANQWYETRWEEMVRRLFRDGELFLRLFNPKRAGGLEDQTGPRVGFARFIDPDEIADRSNRFPYGIETEPNDVETILKYHRAYTAQDGGMASEVIAANDVVSAKILVDMNQLRGISILIGIAKYIKHYDDWLGDRIRLNKMRQMYNMLIKPMPGVTPAAAKNMFADETSTPAGGTPSKKKPKPGSAIISQGFDYEFISMNLNAADTAADGRAIERMITKATLLVEGIVTGDYSNQNFASSLVAESPMVKMVERWQDIISGITKAVVKKVIQQGKRFGGLAAGADDVCECNFASMVHRELDKDTTAYMVHREQGWASDRTITSKLGYDYEAEQEQIKKEEEEAIARDEQRQNRTSSAAPGRPGQVVNPKDEPEEES